LLPGKFARYPTFEIGPCPTKGHTGLQVLLTNQRCFDPKEFIPSIQKGFEAAMTNGHLPVMKLTA